MSGKYIRLENKFGFLGALGTTELLISSDAQATYPYLAAAVIVKVSSTDVNDTVLGSGARMVTLFGLGVGFLEISETVPLNGQTEVETTLAFCRIFRITVDTAGVSQTNEGDIYVGTGTVTDGIPAVILSHVDIGEAQSLFGGYTIPTGMVGHIKEFVITGGRSAGNTQALITLRIRVREEDSIFQTKMKHQIIAAGIGEIDLPTGAFELSAHSDYEPRAVSSAANTFIGVTTIIELRTA